MAGTRVGRTGLLPELFAGGGELLGLSSFMYLQALDCCEDVDDVVVVGDDRDARMLSMVKRDVIGVVVVVELLMTLATVV